MQRHKEITLRKPQATSLSRATIFNHHNVSSFCNKYKELLEKYKFLPENIYNIDDSGVTTVHTCIIDGIDDSSVQIGARADKYNSPKYAEYFVYSVM